ncbi:hypothetical protein H6P81_006135 [Aristolochia fimbriata]|uniref:Uncharacterized protein n=1 Tax=Aristolochia fimbriata TaxID=158543 RepID=A0AAV7EXN0_ARIFI|nr:hypothetical protein H6P81_006135 [Aristolochia fimbriata]
MGDPGERESLRLLLPTLDFVLMGGPSELRRESTSGSCGESARRSYGESHGKRRLFQKSIRRNFSCLTMLEDGTSMYLLDRGVRSGTDSPRNSRRGEDNRRQLAIVLPSQIGEGAEAELTVSPNQEVPINEDGKRRVSERGDVTIPDCFIGMQEKEEMARNGSGPKTVGPDERHEIEHVKANGDKEVESQGPDLKHGSRACHRRGSAWANNYLDHGCGPKSG